MMDVEKGRVFTLKVGCGMRRSGVGLAVGGCFSVVALTAQAGYISPAEVGGVDCTNTEAFLLSDDCVGQITNPNNEAGGNPSTLLTYLNGEGLQQNFVGWVMDGDAWGIAGEWQTISNPLNAPDELPGTSLDGYFQVTGEDRYSGDWSFDLGGSVLDYLVVTIKDGGGWSAYYYDLTSLSLTSFSDTWDTLGITNGNGGVGPEVSHMFAAYITGTRDPDDPDTPENPIPTPGTLILLALGLGSLGWCRRRC